jgi:16S rRNA (adenine1518-N6/adenine1519-N6)-dimethyltransferase
MNQETFDSTSEQLPVVDNDDRLIATASRVAVHQNEYLHRAVHILVFTSRGELLIQKRAADKDSYPGCWDISVGGHVHVGESYEAAARRELLEELGIRARITRLAKIPGSADTGWEHIVLFKARYDGPINPNPQEIQECRFVHLNTIAKEIEQKVYPSTPALRYAITFWKSQDSSTQSKSTKPTQAARQVPEISSKRKHD